MKAQAPKSHGEAVSDTHTPRPALAGRDPYHADLHPETDAVRATALVTTEARAFVETLTLLTTGQRRVVSPQMLHWIARNLNELDTMLAFATEPAEAPTGHASAPERR